MFALERTLIGKNGFELGTGEFGSLKVGRIGGRVEFSDPSTDCGDWAWDVDASESATEPCRRRACSARAEARAAISVA